MSKKSNKEFSESEKIADYFAKSQYSVCAPGMRFVNYWEVFEIIKIIRYSNTGKILEDLENLHKYHPDTIEIDKSYQESQCEGYIEGVCKCFLPDSNKDDCRIKQKRKKYLETTDYRNTPEYKEWRLSVFERDNFTCADCDIKGGGLNAHHIKKFKDFPKDRYKINNGTTLCIKCHRKRHKK